MLVDNERLVLRLKQELIQKNSWGQRELLVLLTELEVECVLDNDPPEHEGPLQPAAKRRSGMPDGAHPLVAEGATNGRQDQEAAGVH